MKINMDKLWRECLSIERKNGMRVENYESYFLFTNLRTLRETKLYNYNIEEIVDGKNYKQAAQAVIKYAKQFL